MTTPHPVQGTPELPTPGQCWCCGCAEDPGHMVHLGDHPEVAVCTRCAHSLHTCAWELEDQAKTGVAVRIRKMMRRLRRAGFQRGWHNNQLIGKPLRWLGKHIP